MDAKLKKYESLILSPLILLLVNSKFTKQPSQTLNILYEETISDIQFMNYSI